MPPKVKSLKINPPRRRESERMKSRRSVSGPSTPSTATSRTSSAGDTIEVAMPKSSEAAVERTAEATSPGETMKDVAADASQEVSMAIDEVAVDTAASPTQPAGEDEKADEEIVDVDDTVTEYDFTNEKDSGFDDDEDDDHGGKFIDDDKVRDVIEISSDDGVPAEDFAPDMRPWLSLDSLKLSADNKTKIRAAREQMFCEQRRRPFKDDWEETETYQRALDDEMEEYIKDFPLQHWTIDQGEVRRGFERMLDRKRLRALGVPIFAREIHAQMGIQTPHPPQMPMPQHHGNSGHRGHHQMPMPQHHMPPQMPPPHMMHHGATYHYTPPGAMPSPFVLPSHHLTQQVGVNHNGQPFSPPVALQHHQPPPPSMPPPSRAPSHSQLPEQRAPVKRAESAMQPQPTDGGRRKRQKRETAATTAAAVPPTTPFDPDTLPPYATRTRPTVLPGRARIAVPDVFPWNRKLDFQAAKKSAQWDSSIYTHATIHTMRNVRATNAKAIEAGVGTSKKGEGSAAVDKGSELAAKLNKVKEQEKAVEQAKADQQKKAGEPKTAEEKEAAEEEAMLTDKQPYGNFCYATGADIQKASILAQKSEMAFLQLPKKPSVGELMQAAEKSPTSIDLLNGINICWSPAKAGVNQELQQITFSVRDTLRTRQKLATTPILTNEAAECVIDFCPDLLWRDMLLRIISETSFRNQELHNRMCENGNWIAVSSITKRIGHALGWKQGKSKTPEDADDEDDVFYRQNVVDLEKYQNFFDKYKSHRKAAIVKSRKSKARDGTETPTSSASGSRPGSSGSDGSVVVVGEAADAGEERMMTRSLSGSKGKGKVPALPQLDGAGGEEGDAVVANTEQKRKAMDEVSVQSDGELDRRLAEDDDD